jgi:hypothetical protein
MRKLGDQWVEVINGQEHIFKAVEPLINGNTDIKDLGILNEDGCLTNCWGEYPGIEELADVHTREHWFRCITRNNVYCATESYKTKQQAIDAWNRRS